jgi:hypothetical protein
MFALLLQGCQGSPSYLRIVSSSSSCSICCCCGLQVVCQHTRALSGTVSRGLRGCLLDHAKGSTAWDSLHCPHHPGLVSSMYILLNPM